METDRRLSFADGKTQHVAYIEDHAFYISGLLDVFEASSIPQYLSLALFWDQQVQQHYEHPEGGWYRNHKDSSSMIVREMPNQDKAEPSGASYMVHNLLRLYALTSDDQYRQRAERAFARYSTILNRKPLVLDDMLIAVDWKYRPPKEIILATKNAADATPFVQVVQQDNQNHVLVILTEENKMEMEKILPITSNKPRKNNQTTAYICQQGVCQFPTTNVMEFERQLHDAP